MIYCCYHSFLCEEICYITQNEIDIFAQILFVTKITRLLGKKLQCFSPVIRRPFRWPVIFPTLTNDPIRSFCHGLNVHSDEFADTVYGNLYTMTDIDLSIPCKAPACCRQIEMSVWLSTLSEAIWWYSMLCIHAGRCRSATRPKV